MEERLDGVDVKILQSVHILALLVFILGLIAVFFGNRSNHVVIGVVGMTVAFVIRWAIYPLEKNYYKHKDNFD